MSENVLDEWETPFMDAHDPSVGLITETDGERSAILVVAPQGLDEYPKFLVHFTGVLAANYCEEAGSVVSLGRENKPQEFCCYLWRSSPQVVSYKQIVFFAEEDLRHYIILGGDNIASIVCSGEPRIEEVSSPKRVVVSYAI